MRVAHVIAGIDDPAAGTTYAVTRLCETLGRRGLDIELHTLAPLSNESANGYRQIAYPRSAVPAKLGLSGAMRVGLREAAAGVHIIHNHGLWMMPNVYAGAAAQRAGRPFVCSVHGTLAPVALRRSRWKKSIFGLVAQRASLAAVSCFHATSVAEYGDIRRLGFPQPICVVPFGIDVPPPTHRQGGDRRTLLFLGRVDPIKQVDVLLMAWRAVENAFPEWDLVICGPDNGGHLPAMQRLAQDLGTARVSFVGPKYGGEKDKLLDSCDLFVLPSFSENFGFVVAEALAHGMPAIMTRAAPWDGLERHRCGWWIDIGSEALEACLRQALFAEPETLAEMGQRGREWMSRDFSWVRVGEMMDQTYQWLMQRTEKPEWVRAD